MSGEIGRKGILEVHKRSGRLGRQGEWGGPEYGHLSVESSWWPVWSNVIRIVKIYSL